MDHWVLFDLPTHTAALSEGVIKVDEVFSGCHQGRNDFRKIGYVAPSRLPENLSGQQGGTWRRPCKVTYWLRLSAWAPMGADLEAVREHLWMFLWETGKKLVPHSLSSNDSMGCVSGFDP